jgi:hypothetical protein
MLADPEKYKYFVSCTVPNWTVRIARSFSFGKNLNGIIQSVLGVGMRTLGNVVTYLLM